MVTKKEIPLQVGGKSLTSLLYYDTARDKLPAIFITPVLGDFTVLEQCLAGLLSRCGFAVFITSFMPQEPFSHMIGDIQVHDRAYQLSVQGISALVSYARSQPFIDDANLGLMGMSLGGIFTALNCRLHAEFKASVIVAGGGDNRNILALSQNPIIKLMREVRMQRLGLTLEEYRELIDENIRWDALKVKRPVDRESLYMFIAEKDEHVPTVCQRRTWEQFGRPRAEFANMGHFPLLALIPTFYFPRILRFFQERFQLTKN
jgi:dienelactone hydrolase